MFFIKVENRLVISKTDYDMSELPEGHIEISKILYDSIGNIPCSFTEVEGEIVSFEYIERPPEPTPEPTELELLQTELESTKEAVNFLLMNLI